MQPRIDLVELSKQPTEPLINIVINCGLAMKEKCRNNKKDNGNGKDNKPND